VGKIAKLKILQGDPLTAQKFFADASMAGFTGSIPADKRAISIAITDITGISGFAKPGDYVDVILINSKSRKNAISGTTILQNVLLLAVNKTNAGKTADSNKESMATATLALAPADTLRLAVSQSQGTLYLALRPFKPQNGFVPTSEFLAYQYEPAAEPQQSAAADYAVPPPVPSAHSIPVIRGNSVSTVEVR
jgi:pilus assembly protein CpaB